VCVSKPEGLKDIQWDKLDPSDAHSLNQWVEAFHQDVFRLMKHLTNQREVAEDLTQQTFLKAWKAIQSFDGRSSMRVWLHAIAYREYASWRRKHRFFAPFENILERGRSHAHETETRIVLMDALEGLSADHREAFILHEVYGHSFEDMAQILRISEGTLKSRAYYARQSLQKKLRIDDVMTAGELNGI
jgi:RNA polymerase sigma-70 factor (ECF subfamily)